MQHLFIVNPQAKNVRGHVDEVVQGIHAFFENYGQVKYHVHITRWARDAVGYTHRFVLNATEVIRVYAVGGTGTLFEVVNGVVGLPNVQVAFFPHGECNGIVRYFGANKMPLFQSLRNLFFSDTTPIDVLKCGNNYGVGFCSIGFEAYSSFMGDALIEKTHVKSDVGYTLSGLINVIKLDHNVMDYTVSVDGVDYPEVYFNILVANLPTYGVDMSPAIEAHPNDGVLDIYLVKHMPSRKMIRSIPDYLAGKYQKHPDFITHVTAKKMTVKSQRAMPMCLDGENFYDNMLSIEIVPYAVDFVCPSGINLCEIPKVYQRVSIRHAR